MKPFLQRYYEGIRKHIGDPVHAGRITEESMYEELTSIDADIFEKMLMMTGQHSRVGWAETLVTVKDGVKFYPLPLGFRRFISFKRFDDEGREIQSLESQPEYSSQYGVEILSSERGFKLDPAPTLESDQEWTLEYLRGPGLTHYATASGYGEYSIVSGVPPESPFGGELVLVPDYYAGMVLRVYSADSGAPQVRVISGSAVNSGQVTFVLRDRLNPLSGVVSYEILPCLPDPLFKVHIFDGAIQFLGDRQRTQKMEDLIRLRSKAWDTARGHVMSNAMDRPSTRPRKIRPLDRMPTGETIVNRY